VNLTWANWLALAAGSGLTAGIANQLFSWLRENRGRSFTRDQYRRDIEHQKLMLLDQRRHEALLRAEQAHYEARPTFLPYARHIHAWLYAEWADLYNRDFAYPARTRSPDSLQGPAEVLAELGEIAVAHPTRHVRDLVRELDARIDARYNLLVEGQARQPTREELESWLGSASRLIEAIHEFVLSVDESTAGPDVTTD